MFDNETADTRDRATAPSQDLPEIIRSEEVLHVSTRTVPVNRVTMKKVIVTETQTFTVQVRREEVRLITEPLTEESALPPGTDTSVDVPDITMVLHEESVVISTEVVPVERVRLVRHRVVDSETVTADVRTEKIALDTTGSATHRDV
ncbi:hypothetical protein B7R22_02240 [Subtercola boreus]|uniref:DUF2382 domain-containing protein n=1 Tax=Subtercola boreus TaxID=120213 RepID=A0A3E0W4H5_9MICO|nr:DUF2382 domain-containing protein [Subtercola boreus]RFA16890.1 hypothetical protein B7R22_02240 [Subtercola boreus]